jgi:hypothetical protein
MYLKGTENREVLFNLLLDRRLGWLLKTQFRPANAPDTTVIPTAFM